jgi:hypothetical protein
MVHENSTNIEMFYPLGVAILCHQNWEYQMVDRALTQSPNSLLPSNAYTHMKVGSVQD